MNIAWKRTVDATLEPVTLAEAKLHLRVTGTTEDANVTRAIASARLEIEDYLHWGLITQTWKYTQDVFTSEIPLPMAARLQNVTSVQYYDTAGALQTASTSLYDVDTISAPGRILLKPNQVWPVTQANKGSAVTITYVVGETAAANVGANIVSALLLLVGDRWEHREQTVMGPPPSVLPRGVEALLAPQRIWWAPPSEAA